MRLSSGHLRISFLSIAMCAAFALSGCGHWCFAGYSSPGNGSPTQPTDGTTCASSHANGTVRVVALKSPICKDCTPSSDVQHVFVTLRGIQLHANTMNEPGDADWVEIAPQLAKVPRQIDLIGDSSPEMLVENAPVPAEYYREIRLQFFEGAPANAGEPAGENACGNAGWNCVLHADGTIEALNWSSNTAELVIPLESMHSNSMVVLPDVKTELQLKLGFRREFLISSSEGWRVQNMLAGSATVAEPQSLAVENSPTD